MVKFLQHNIFNLGEMENNSSISKMKEFDLLKVIHKAFNVIRIKANENKINLEAKIGQKSDLQYLNTIYGDEQRYLQILVNFVSNALKFTNQNGTISIDINIQERYLLDVDSGAYHIKYSISISNTGDRISQEQQNQIFVDSSNLDQINNRGPQEKSLRLSVSS